MENLADDLTKEIARVRKVLQHYKNIGAAEMLGTKLLEQDLIEADEAAMSGDVVRMLKIYNILKKIVS